MVRALQQKLYLVASFNQMHPSIQLGELSCSIYFPNLFNPCALRDWQRVLCFPKSFFGYASVRAQHANTCDMFPEPLGVGTQNQIPPVGRSSLATLLTKHGQGVNSTWGVLKRARFSAPTLSQGSHAFLPVSVRVVACSRTRKISCLIVVRLEILFAVYVFRQPSEYRSNTQICTSTRVTAWPEWAERQPTATDPYSAASL